MYKLIRVTNVVVVLFVEFVCIEHDISEQKPRYSFTMGVEIQGTTDMDTVCDLLDKLTLRQLQLMEDKIKHEMNIENSVNKGTFQLAKSRYIMGHSSITATKLPIENSPEFSASTVCKSLEEDGFKQLKAVQSDSENRINPLRWFGVLVPQNLYTAQSIFQNAINYAVECVNVQLQLHENSDNIVILKDYKKKLLSS